MGEVVLLQFACDAETMRILEKVGLEKKDDYINRAVQAYATSGGAFDYAAGKGGSASSLGASLSAGLAAGLPGGTTGGSLPSSSAQTSAFASSSPGDLGSQLNAELERLLGANCGVSASLSSGNPQMVEFHKAGGEKIASLELSECQSILKSLRPPISFAEVVEMLTLMSVG